VRRGREIPTLAHSLTHFYPVQVDALGGRWTVDRPIPSGKLAFLDIDGRCPTSMWWAHQDSNLEPKDYEAATESSRINDIALCIVPVTARETIDP